MSVTKRYSHYAAQVGATLLDGIQSQSINTGTEVVGQSSDGEVYVRTQNITAINPSGNFNTLDVARALNAMGVTPRDLIAIFEALSRAGALQASLEIM